MQRCKDLPEELKEFPVITKAPANFFLSGEHAVMFGTPALCQPVALYVYAGVRKTKDGGIKVLSRKGEPGLYRPNPNAVQKIEFDSFKPVDAVNLIESLLTKEFPNRSAEICLYLTAPSRCGLATSGAVGAALSLAIHWLFSSKKDREKIEKTTQDLNKSGRNLSELAKTDTFKRIYRLAWKIDSIFHDYKSSGANAFTSLAGSPHGFPVIYQGELRKELYDNREVANTDVKPLSAKDSAEEVHFELYDGLDFFAKDIHEIESTADARVFPLVVTIIYSGIEKQTGLAIRRAEYMSTMDVVSSNKVQLKAVKDFSWRDIMFLVGLCSQKMIHSILMFFKGERERITTIMNITQTIQNVLRDFLGVSTPKIEEICRLAGTRGFSAKLTGGGTGGDVVILCPLEKIDVLEDLLKELGNKGFSTHLSATKWSDHEGALRTMPGKLVNSEAYYNLLFFDVVNSTGKEEQVNKFFKVLEQREESTENFLKRSGDAGYVSFPTPEDSIEYGKYLIATAINQGIEIRIGIHSSHDNWPKGINISDEQYLSMSVVVQCQKLAESSSIVISENVRNELPSEEQDKFGKHKVVKKQNLEIETYIWRQNK